MPRSPNRNRSPSSRQRANKRDYRYSHKQSEDRYYGGQSRKKVHRNDYYDDQQRDKSRKPLSSQQQDDDNNRSKRKQSYQQRPNITLVEKQPYNKQKRSQPESQIKVHFRFKPIKVKLQQQHEEQILKLLKTHVSKKQSTVEHFQKSADSRSGYLVIEFGFKYDSDAFAYLKDKFSDIDLTIEKEKHNITAQPTKIFKILIDQAEDKKKKAGSGGKSRSASKEDTKRNKEKQRERGKERSKQRPQKRSDKKKRRHNSTSRSRSQSSSRSSSSQSSRSRRSSRKDRRDQRQSRKHHRNQFKDRSKDRRRSPQNGNNLYKRESNIQPSSSKFDFPATTSTRSLVKQLGSQKKLKTLYFFGIHYSVNLKDMDNLFYSHESGPFKHEEFLMRRMKNSLCEYMQGRFEQKDANKILQIGDKLQVKGHPFIVFESESNDLQKLLQKLSQFQVNLQFPQKIEPYYILKQLKKQGKVIQIITLNKLTQQDRSEYYNITFNSKPLCDEFKSIRHDEICIQQVTGDNVINVFRPNFKTQLIPVSESTNTGGRYESDGKSNNSYQQQQQSNKDKDKDNRSSNNNDNKDYRSYQKQY